MNRLQMKVEQLRKATADEVDKADLLPSTTYDVDELWRRLWWLCGEFHRT